MPDPVDPALVRAMPMVLRIEKSAPPSRQGLLEAAARACAAACLDPRAAPDGPWAPAFDAWCAGAIRKVVRRARGAQWSAAQDLPGVTVGIDGAQARAYVPGPVGELDRRLSRLQIGGTDVPGELPTAPSEAGLCLWLAPELPMTVGKAAAQVAHAAMLAVPLLPAEVVDDWYRDGCPLAVRQADTGYWSRLRAAAAAGRAVAVHDAGFTEVRPGSCTVIAEWR
ncbi:peptidyl-tRNA hydrolase [Gordonia hirsuta]|nr:peptidyl-tRNA hydrolase [Gordonia hirsuta]